MTSRYYPYDEELGQLVDEENEINELLKSTDENDPLWDELYEQLKGVRKEQEKTLKH